MESKSLRLKFHEFTKKNGSQRSRHRSQRRQINKEEKNNEPRSIKNNEPTPLLSELSWSSSFHGPPLPPSTVVWSPIHLSQLEPKPFLWFVGLFLKWVWFLPWVGCLWVCMKNEGKGMKNQGTWVLETRVPLNSILSHSICYSKFDHFKLEMLIS